MKYCFDIDDTICKGGVPYEDATPYPKVVNRINELYESGDHIIISTSRGYWSGKDWYSFTKNQRNDLKQKIEVVDKYLISGDARRKEPKKFGGPGARRRKQKSYR